MKILKSVMDEILETVGKAPVESGGILGRRGDTLCAYCFDDGNYSPEEYRPDTKKLNPVIEKWAEEGIDFAGIVHSHAHCLNILSMGDVAYAAEILASSPQISDVIFPVVTVRKGRPEITFFRCTPEPEKISVDPV